MPTPTLFAVAATFCKAVAISSIDVAVCAPKFAITSTYFSSSPEPARYAFQVAVSISDISEAVALNAALVAFNVISAFFAAKVALSPC